VIRRSCRSTGTAFYGFLALWLELLEFPICVLVYRSPLEVARSLEIRNGFSLSFSLALWERYTTASLNATREHPRFQVNHAELIADPVATVRDLTRGLETLGVRGLRSPSDEEILAFIDPSLYRAKEKEIANPRQLSAAQRKLQLGGMRKLGRTAQSAVNAVEHSLQLFARRIDRPRVERQPGRRRIRNGARWTDGGHDQRCPWFRLGKPASPNCYSPSRVLLSATIRR